MYFFILVVSFSTVLLLFKVYFDPLNALSGYMYTGSLTYAYYK